MFGGEAALESQVGHPQNAIQRGADFMAHGGQEGAFRLIGRLSTFLGHHQLTGAGSDQLFEMVTVCAQFSFDFVTFFQFLLNGFVEM